MKIASSRNRWTLIVGCVALFLSSSAAATNGYFTHGTGVKNEAMAGAGVAAPEDAIAIAINPASAVLVGDHEVFGLDSFSPRRSYTTTASQAMGNFGAFTVGPNEINSSREWFFIPHFAMTREISDNSAWGFAFYGRGGMNTEWDGGSASFDPDGPGPAPVMTLPGTFGDGATGVDLTQGFFNLSYARMPSDRFAWGVTGIVAAQSFRVKGINTFAPYTESFARSGGTAMPQYLSDNGHEYSYGAGAMIGFNALVSPRLRLAGAYQSKIYMTEFDDYADLFAGDGDFDIPAAVTAGASFNVRDDLMLSVDVQHVMYGDIDSVGNPMANLYDCPTAGMGGTDFESCLGGDNGAGFGWDDVTTVKLGLSWQSRSGRVWRFGLSRAEQPISSDEVLFNILAPGVVENHVTFGVSDRLQSGREWSVGLMYAFNESVSGANPFDPSQTIELEMKQLQLGFSLGWRD